MRGAECRRFPCAIRKISSTHVITWYDTKQTRHGPGGYPDAAKQVECKRVQTQCVYLVSVSCKRPCAFCRYVFKSDMECLMSSCRGRFYLPNCVSNFDNFLTGAGNTRSTCAQVDALCEHVFREIWQNMFLYHQQRLLMDSLSEIGRNLCSIMCAAVLGNEIVWDWLSQCNVNLWQDGSKCGTKYRQI